MRRSVWLSVVAAFALGALSGPGAVAKGTISSAKGPLLPVVSPQIAKARLHGYVQAPSYLRAKALIDAAARAKGAAAGSSASSGSEVSPNAPVITQSFEGPHDALVSPSDSVGAIGPTRFVNLVNEQYAIFDRTGPVPVQLSTGPLDTFTTVSHDQFGLFDPQIIWDPGTQHFYYVMDDIVCGAFSCVDHEDYKLAWGFSKTDSPNTPADWCHYQTDFGGVYGLNGDFPDYPKLGDTQDFILIGVNVYPHLTSFQGSDIGWIGKPAGGPIVTCPDQSTLKSGVAKTVKQADGTTAFTPVPANQVDDSGTGYVLANADLGDPGDPGASPGGVSGDTITVFTVTKNLDGTANIPNPGRTFRVQTYSIPPSAPQMGTADTLDTLDGRLTNAVQATDPRFNITVLFTQHTVAGGAGSEVRWYRIKPETLKFKMGKVTDGSLYVFNAAISSDRRNDGTTGQFGDAEIIGFNTSSSSTLPAIQMVSKIRAGVQSGFVLVHQSDSADMDFTCEEFDGTPCRWGDYAAAGPDPASDPGGTQGVVWLTSMWATEGDPIFGSNWWRTWNWAAMP